MRISKLCYLGFCSMALAIGLLSCTEESAIVEVTSVTLDSTSVTLIEGEDYTLTATISPYNADNQKVLWSSDNSSVASVKDGVVTAIKVGTATITAISDDGGKTATCTVTVAIEIEAETTIVTGVTLNKTSYEMTEGYKLTLTATVSPENATNKNVTWSSSNTSVAIVNNGKVKALKAGTATITVETEDQGKIATCDITVKPKDITDHSGYIDEYGINHGPGVEIDGVVWAPVNCGYHETDYPYGKLYQWGRKYGQGYSGAFFKAGQKVGYISDATYPAAEDGTIKEGGVSLSVGQSESNEDIFYLGYYYNSDDWLDSSDDELWNAGTETSPVKNNANDPCPEGWRVPTNSELDGLCDNFSKLTINEYGQEGYWLSGSSAYDVNVPQIFLSAAGYREKDGRNISRGSYGSYWSSCVLDYGACHIAFENTLASNYFTKRSRGLSVRCVQE